MTGIGYPVDDRLPCGTDLQRSQRVMLRMLCVVDRLCVKYEIVYWLDGGTLLGAVRHHGFIPWDDDIDIVMPKSDYNRFVKIAQDLLPEDMYVQTNELDSNYKRYRTPCKIRDRYSRIREGTDVKAEQAEMGIFIDIIPMDKFHASGLAFKRDYALKWIYRKLSVLPYAKLMSGRGFRRLVNNALVRLRPIIGSRFWLMRYRNFLRKFVVVRNNKMKDDYLIGYGFDSYWFRFFDPKDIFPLQKVSFEGHQFSAPANTDAVLKIFYGDYMRLPPEEERKPSHFVLLDIDTRVSGKLPSLGNQPQ